MMRSVARGSTNVAVPTPTAHAPARSISAASSPLVTPPVPMIGTVGWAAATSHTARSASALIGGPLSPPPPAPSRLVRVRASIRRPIAVLTSVKPSAPASIAAPAIATRSVTLGDNFAKTRVLASRASTTACTTSRVAVVECANTSRALLDVRAREVDLDRDDPVGDRLARPRRRLELVDAPTPDRHDHACSGRLERGQVARDPFVDARAGQADGVQHAAARRLGDAQRRVALRREHGHGLRRHRAEPRRRAQPRQLRAVPERARRGNDRIRQRRPRARH